jgi:ATP-binding cassette subfamily B multidrug efflux pump
MKNLVYLNKYFWKYRGRLFMGFILIAAGNVFSVYAPAVVRDGIDFLADTLLFANSSNPETMLQQPKSFVNILSWIGMEAKPLHLNRENFTSIAIRIGIWLAVLYLVMFIIKGIFLFYQRQAIIVMSRHVEYDLKNEVFDKYQQLDQTFYKNNRTGDLMNRISEDVNRVRMYVGPAVMYTLNLVVLVVMSVVVMLQIDAELTLYTLSPLPFMMIAIFYVSKVINKKSDQVQVQQSALSTMVQETTSGIRVLKSLGREKYFEEVFAEASDDYKKKQLQLVKTDALFMPVIILLVGLSTILTVYVGAQKVMAGEISPGVIVQFVFYVNILTWPFAIVGWVSSLVQKAEASQRRINEFLQTESDIKNEQQEESMPQGDLRFEHVTYNYTDSGIKGLNDVSFHIPQGTTLGIIGRTGSGKSTLANLIPRMMEPTSGRITIGGIELGQIHLGALRKNIGYVPQDVFLFSESINNNIAFGAEKATPEIIEQAAKDAAIHDNIMGFPRQYETILGERGINVSGGQKQRISIARAIIKNPDLLIFDDCLSAVDTETEDKILASLKRIMKGKTSIIIAHRISSIKDADNIIVLDHGKVAEEGKHEDLLALNGKYAALYRRQLVEEKST